MFLGRSKNPIRPFSVSRAFVSTFNKAFVYTHFFALLALLSFATSSSAQTVAEQLNNAALARTQHFVIYDGTYTRLAYPNGDVAPNKGVCTDVIIRSYRALGVDLQKNVHEDMQQHFELYPSKRIWGMTKPDSNIDHHRVPNLQAYFARHGEVLPVSQSPLDYLPGDLVTWLLPGNLPHIGIVVNKNLNNTPLVVHNIGRGPKLEDALFRYPITGHYRYLPDVSSGD